MVCQGVGAEEIGCVVLSAGVHRRLGGGLRPHHRNSDGCRREHSGRRTSPCTRRQLRRPRRRRPCDLLTIQVHAWAAATSDDEIAAATRNGVERLRVLAIEHLDVNRAQATRMISVMAFYNINASINLDNAEECSVAHLLGDAME